MVIVEVRDLQGPRATVTALRASPFRLYAVDSGGTCYLWEKVDQEYDSNPTVTVPLHAGPMLGLEVDGSFLFAVSADQIQVLLGTAAMSLNLKVSIRAQTSRLNGQMESN